MRFIRRLFLLTLTLAIAAVAYSLYAYTKPVLSENKTIVIAPGTGARGLLAQLHNEAAIPSPTTIALPIFLSGNYRSFKAGEYEFFHGDTPAEILSKIARGEVVVHKVTIPEGWNIWQVRDALMKEDLLTGDVPTLTEGSLAPDTMHYQRGETRASVVSRMQKAQTERLAKAWEKRNPDLPIKTPEEALTLASIVERETGIEDERNLVAGVFINRLRMGMPLQSDPTVVYGIEHARGGRAMGRDLSRADLKTDTVYNTYTRPGLPPTPICNPGLKAIEATLNPATTDALYFVATGNGGHRFAATLKQHEQNVAMYRKALREEKQQP